MLLTLMFSSAAPSLGAPDHAGSAAPASTNPGSVITWNGIAQRTAIAVAKQYQTQSMIYIARVWGGIHYRGSVVVGTVLGAQVAPWTLSRYFLPED